MVAWVCKSKQPHAEITVNATFTVSDTGIGISASDLKQLFKPFSQAGAEIAARFGGAGLGLASVQQIARAMGGDVAVKARRGGADFVLKVRLGRVAAVPRSEATRRRKVLADAPKVLCVEDNPFARVVFNTVLSELGCQVEFAESGEAALKAVARATFDVVLMDMVLPGIDGVDRDQAVCARAAKRRRCASSACPVVTRMKRRRVRLAPTTFC